MAYTESYQKMYDLLETEEERERFLKDDIPMFVPTGEVFEMTEEEKEDARKRLLKLIEDSKNTNIQ